MLSPSHRSYAHGNATLLPAEEKEMRVQCYLLRGNMTRSGTGRWKDTRLRYKEALGDGELRLLRGCRLWARARGWRPSWWRSAGVETDLVHSAVSIPRVWA